MPDLAGVFAHAPRVTLDDMLAAREQRQARQHTLLAAHRAPLLSLTLNIPGDIKQFPLARKTYRAARDLALRHLERGGYSVLAVVESSSPTGNEGCFALARRGAHGEAQPADATALKRHLIALEESCTLARLFDLDVLDATGRVLSRRDFGLPPRRCLVCDAPAAACARSQAHDLATLRRRVVRLMQGHFTECAARAIAGHATRSLLYEVCTTPKPGLVDRNNNGAHTDMDIYTFMDSVSVLTPYFATCARLGADRQELAPEALFAALRYHGLNAEDAMRAATHGVNTHKGAIFSLGIICAAAGRLWGQGVAPAPAALSRLSAAMTASVLDECANPPPGLPLTNGLRLYARGVTGARGEAVSGFASVLTHGLPALKAALAAGAGADVAGCQALMHLMAHVFDTNIISRGDMAQQAHVQRILQGLTAEARPNMDALLELDAWCIARNISPGGCADLLGLTWMLHFLEQDASLAPQE